MDFSQAAFKPPSPDPATKFDPLVSLKPKLHFPEKPDSIHCNSWLKHMMLSHTKVQNASQSRFFLFPFFVDTLQFYVVYDCSLFPASCPPASSPPIPITHLLSPPSTTLYGQLHCCVFIFFILCVSTHTCGGLIPLLKPVFEIACSKILILYVIVLQNSFARMWPKREKIRTNLGNFKEFFLQKLIKEISTRELILRCASLSLVTIYMGFCCSWKGIVAAHPRLMYVNVHSQINRLGEKKYAVIKHSRMHIHKYL